MNKLREQKASRCDEANKVIMAISQHGRRFFQYKDRVSFFQVDLRGRVWYHDKYSQKSIYTHYRGRWKGFSEGGTLLNLIKALKGYIMTGVPISNGHFGPWHQTLCEGDLWGYGFDEMEEVRKKVFQTLAVRRPVKEGA